MPKRQQKVTEERVVVAGIYCRISQDNEGDELGVRRQEQDARTLCERKGWTVAEVFVDDDISAWSGKPRPSYERMLKAIEAREINAVAVYDLDRLNRQPRDLERFFEICDRAGVTDLASVGGTVDLATSDGRFHARIMGAVAAKSSDDTSRRIKRKQGRPGRRGASRRTQAFRVLARRHDHSQEGGKVAPSGR